MRGYNFLPTSPERKRRASEARRLRSGLVALFVNASKPRRSGDLLKNPI
jgi:hypothetical protein